MRKVNNAIPALLVSASLLSACGGDTNPVTAPLQHQEMRTTSRAEAPSNHDDVVQRLYVGYFGRAADPGGLAYYAKLYRDAGAPTTVVGMNEAYGSSSQIRALVDSFGTSAESAALYPGDNATFIAAIYRNIFNRTADTAGAIYWTDLLDRKLLTRASAALALMSSARGSDVEALSQKAIAAQILTDALAKDSQGTSYSNEKITAVVRQLMSNVSDRSDLDAFRGTVGATLTVMLKNDFSCAGTPAAATIGPFQTYAGDCLVSYQLSAAEMKSLADYDGSSAAYSKVNAIEHAVTAHVKAQFKDNFDTIFYIWDLETKPANAPYGYYQPTGQCTRTPCPRLQGTMTIPFWNDALRDSPLLHEILHRYANKVLPSTDTSHWGFSSVGGQLGGWDASRFQALGDNQYHAAAPLVFVPGTPKATIDYTYSMLNAFSEYTSGGNSVPYAPLELYSMGLIPASEVPDVQIAQSPVWVDRAKGNFSATGFTSYSANAYGDLMAAAGLAKPDPAKAIRNYRALVVVLTDKTQLTSDVTTKLTSSITQFTMPSVADSSWSHNGVLLLHNFWMATGGRATYAMNQASSWRKQEAPTCQISADYGTVAPAANVQLNASCAPTASDYIWSHQGSGVNQNATVTVSPTQSTTYTVKGVNSLGQGAAVSVRVQVVPGLPKNLPGGYVWHNNRAWAPVALGAARLNYANALAYCSTTALNDQTGWRLPTRDELEGLLKAGVTPPTSAQPIAWTSTPYSPTEQYVLDLESHTLYRSTTASLSAAMCVR
ncbi:DUF4214 domain-containing protein [Massilia arenae]|uniref:DUF4214 domain-containing protein n=1 Tax=Massilia arenae TaxID=2603288 RepID=A0A5C7G4N9_9BURK|nr:DUF4214 domain-containing protein [Massilia arenae]TXG00621.1 DUF4214 domain-containing protein [Massilia arenae]